MPDKDETLRLPIFGSDKPTIGGRDADSRLKTNALYESLIEYEHLRWWTPATAKQELRWAERAGGCFACGTLRSDCELTWEIDEEVLAHAQGVADRDLRPLCRPRRWLCAFETTVCLPRVLCPSCYRLIQFGCVEGIWEPDFMAPWWLQLILPIAEGQEDAGHTNDERGRSL